MNIKFRRDLEVINADVGSEEDVVIRDPVSRKFFTVSLHDLTLLQMLDGSASLEEAIARLKKEGYGYSRGNAQAIVDRAAGSGLLLGTKYSSAEGQEQLAKRAKDGIRAQRYSSLFFLFVPVLNPDRFLSQTLRLFRLVFNKWTAIPFALSIPGALYLLIAGLARFNQQYLFFFNLENLIYLWITIALTKLIHEFSHAYTAKRFGLQVPEMGIAFLIFFPCLYCNTTDAWILGDRKQRMAIAAAGILAEMALAVVSIYIWFFTKPGILNSISFYLMAVSFVSTLLFNANPLMRFDGYFILSDYLKIHNLMSKSLTRIRYLTLNRVLGYSRIQDPSRSLKESTIFTIYGIGTVIYRFFLYTGIVAGVYYRFDKSLGILLAAVAFVLFVVKPVIKGLILVHSIRKEIHPNVANLFIVVALIVAAVALCVVPIPNKTLYPCCAYPLYRQKITLPLLTSIDRAFIREGSRVKAGERLFELNSDQLQLARFKKRIEREVLAQEMQALLLDEKDRAKANEKVTELHRVDHELEIIEGDLILANSGIKAPFDAVVSKLDPKVQNGYQPGKGTIIGELESIDQIVIYSPVPEEEMHTVSKGLGISVWFPIKTGLLLNQNVSSVFQFSERDLKNSPLSSRLGGSIPTEVKGESEKDVLIESRYLCAVYLKSNPYDIPLGMTGRFIVPNVPKSFAAHLVDRAVKVFNRETAY